MLIALHHIILSFHGKSLHLKYSLDFNIPLGTKPLFSFVRYPSALSLRRRGFGDLATATRANQGGAAIAE
jgi:hypothetical protein